MADTEKELTLKLFRLLDELKKKIEGAESDD